MAKEAAKVAEPLNWLKTIENIRRVRQKFPAPVDTMGCAQAHNKNDKDLNQRFQVLVSLMLSSQTKDPITWAAVQKLKEHGKGNVDGILNSKEKDIEDLIYPVGFYKRKAVYLKKVAEIIKRDFGGDIPNSIKELCELPGVGPKMAHLCMSEAWGVISGIGVDTHVHRIAARLRWVPKSTKTPEDTRKALESWLPREYWGEINHMLVGFGQTICSPLRPKCDECDNSEICPSSSFKTTSLSQPQGLAESLGEETAEAFDQTKSEAKRKTKVPSQGESEVKRAKGQRKPKIEDSSESPSNGELVVTDTNMILDPSIPAAEEANKLPDQAEHIAKSSSEILDLSKPTAKETTVLPDQTASDAKNSSKILYASESMAKGTTETTSQDKTEGKRATRGAKLREPKVEKVETPISKEPKIKKITKTASPSEPKLRRTTRATQKSKINHAEKT